MDQSEGTYRLSGGDSEFTLTEQEAFLAMTLFLAQFYSTAGDDLLTLMGDITIEPDGSPFDPAAWADWVECIRAVRGDAAEGDTWRALGHPRIER